MKFLAEYVMRGPRQATLVVALSAALSLLLPPLSYLSGGALGLVTLRLGPNQGLKVGLWAALAVGLLGLVATGSSLIGLLFVVGLWLPVWVLAGSLRRTVSLPRSLLLAGLLGVLVVFAMHALIENPAQWWQGLFEEALKRESEANVQGGALSESMVQISRMMTGILAAGFTLSLVGNLLIARWWQAVLYNPGGFRQEFHQLRLGKTLGLVTALLVLIAGLADGKVAALATDLLMVAVLLHLLQGVAVVHGLIGAAKRSVGWIIAMYGLLVVAMPQTVITLALGGLADAWFDFRAFFGDKTQGRGPAEDG